MTICPWCAQESQSNTVCDWCKRPLDKTQGPPVSARSDLDFLREESEVNRFGAVKAAAVIVGAIACGVLLFLLFKPQNEPVVEAAPPTKKEAPGRKAGNGATVTNDNGSQVIQLPARKPEYWIKSLDLTSDLISNAKWTQQAPRTIRNATITMTRYDSSAVRLQDVDLTIVNLPKGMKRAVGKAVVVNATNRNVVFYRFHLIWGATEYLMIPLQGDSSKLQPVYERVLRPGASAAVQIISERITDHPDGTPTSVRLSAWLDGSPDFSQDDFQILLGR